MATKRSVRRSTPSAKALKGLSKKVSASSKVQGVPQRGINPYRVSGRLSSR